MKVSIKDFRVQEDSFITMDGLTVIQGKNTTEESILESALYSYFHDKDLSGVQVSEISREYSNVILIKDAYEITSLLEELSKEETKEEEKCLSRIKEIINEIVPGIYDIDESGAVYIRDGRFIKLSSLSEEFKLFLFLKILLEKGKINDTTLLILQDAGAHLTPAWQNLLGELLVLLVKEIGATVVLTTYSANLILALEAYMRKYGIEKKSNYYNTEECENGLLCYQCVNNNLEVLYEDTLDAFSKVKVIRDKYL